MFLLARIDVFLIMSGMIPNMYLFMKGTHVHHLNYGIFLLSIVCGYSVFQRPTGRAAEITALFYGAALALTFDEFGMWLHLGGSYWQRVSVDAMILIAALIALLAFASTIKRFESRHLWSFIALVLVLVVFGLVLLKAADKVGANVGPKLQELEESSSP
jgi:asparagine N-glycosylation enzyme membrane subunit Stt3